MTKTKKPNHQPNLPFPPAGDTLHQEGPWLWIPLRREWRDVTHKPEEIVRQHFIRTLVEHYGYTLEQMDQERRPRHGHKSPRADVVIWKSVADKEANRTPGLVTECKSDGIDIQERDYYQGESYTRARAASRMPNDPLVHDGLFDLTKDYYRADALFSAADKLDISEVSFRRIVKQLERFDLSKTGDDIKGLAFEKFLGATFRGELGQFFTPRPVVDFMVDLLNPLEGELICDPA